MSKTIFEKGIDVSKYQGTIDWQAVVSSGVKFAILRCVSTDKSGIYIDPFFERNYAECKKYGIKTGVYYYTYALDKSYADKELALVFSCLEGKSFEYPICVDVEDASTAKLGRQAGTDLLMYQLQALQNNGYYASIYTYYAYQKSYLDMARLQGFDMAIACYTQECYYKGAYGIWQYSSKGSVPGIKGNCDLDFSYKDYSTIMKNAGLNGFIKSTPPHPSQPEPLPDNSQEKQEEDTLPEIETKPENGENEGEKAESDGGQVSAGEVTENIFIRILKAIFKALFGGCE